MGVEPGGLRWTTIPALVRDAAGRHGDRPAIVDGGVSLSFAELSEAAAVATRAFVASGVAPGDRVAVWAPNVAEWVVAALGAHGAGAALVPLNTRFKGHEAGWVLERSRARVLATVSGFLDTDYVDLLHTAMGGPDGDRPVAGLPGLEAVVMLRGEPHDGAIGWDAFLARAGDVAPDEGEKRAAAVAPGDLSDVMFTSGTTGHPKGVRSTHEQTLRAYAAWSEVVGLRPGDRYLVVNPFFHSFGYKAGWVACLMSGASVHPQAVFDPSQVLARVAAERITVLPGPPTLFQSMLVAPDRDRHDLSSLRLAVTGAAVIPVDLVRRMRDDLGFDTVVTGYGLTEATGIATMCRHDDDVETVATTSGRAIPGVEVRIVDDDGSEVHAGEPGEVVVRGYNVMDGYDDEPEETAAAVDADGWLHTGDVGVMDERGYLRITDRKKDMFIVGGFNAYPAEIENALLAHEAVGQVAVVGVPHDRLGEVGMAFVLPAPGRSVDPDELVAWARDRMANYKVPRHVEVVDALPVNAMGKVLKYELRQRAARRVAAAEGEAGTLGR